MEEIKKPLGNKLELDLEKPPKRERLQHVESVVKVKEYFNVQRIRKCAIASCNRPIPSNRNSQYACSRLCAIKLKYAWYDVDGMHTISDAEANKKLEREQFLKEQRKERLRQYELENKQKGV